MYIALNKNNERICALETIHNMPQDVHVHEVAVTVTEVFLNLKIIKYCLKNTRRIKRFFIDISGKKIHLHLRIMELFMVQVLVVNNIWVNINQTDDSTLHIKQEYIFQPFQGVFYNGWSLVFVYICMLPIPIADTWPGTFMFEETLT